MHICIQLEYPQVLVPVLNCPKTLIFWSMDHLLFVYIYHMFIISIICLLLLWTYWTTCSFLHVPCFLRSVFWIFWSNWLLFILQNLAQASHPPQSPLSSFRLGFLSALKALCVSINVLMILYYLHAYFPPLVDKNLLEGDFVLLSLQDSSGHETGVIGE